MNNLPPIIYNYMSIERFEKLLYSGEWQLSNPIHSNDPKERAMEIYGKIQGEEELPAFSCFCDNPYNPMMWHFYGGAYSGVCLGFDTKMMNDILGDSIVFHPMEYLTIQEQGQRSIGNPKESTTDKLKYKNKEWESEKEIRVFFNNIEECQHKLCPNYPNDEYKKKRFLVGMLDFVKEIHLGDRCIIRHFIQTLIEGKKAIIKQGIENTDGYSILNPHCVLFATKAYPDGRIHTNQLCPKKQSNPKPTHQ